MDLDAADGVFVEGVEADGEDGIVDAGGGVCRGCLRRRVVGGELEADEAVVDAGREVGVGG